MVLAAKTSLKYAEKVKKLLVKKELFSKKYKIKKEKNYVYFPVTKKTAVKDAKIVNMKLQALDKATTLKEALKNKLTKKQLSLLPSAFDVVGDIAIIEIKKELEKKEKIIGEALLGLHINLKVVLKKSGIHEGEFRTQKLKVISGEKRKETIYKESGVKLKLDVEKVYFSERLGSERLRIAKQVLTGESILVMFSGCAPYPLVISKNSGAKEIIGIEKNPLAHHYGLINIKLNKVKNVKLLKGDVKDIIPKLKEKFDRIIMPLPKSAEDFLEYALSAAKKGTIIHFYDFQNKTDFPRKSIEKIRKKIENFKVIKAVKCGQYSPGKYRVCIDFIIE
ncbi:class I SAM-dependent methyltransferase family protein [Candidatus Woesearchaeota archaeon]|nr:class I SAM-dependent methyltransferase family protein [Candidatus Woesearchaeota archaeon]